MTPVNSDIVHGDRQIVSTRPDLIRKIRSLRQRLAALEAVLASADEVRPDIGPAAATPPSVAWAEPDEWRAEREGASRRMRWGGGGTGRMRYLTA